jgi:DNA-binding NarL/FixJ family response regulator
MPRFQQQLELAFLNANVQVPVRRIRLVIADDHIAILEAVNRLLASDFDIIATANGGFNALEAITTLHPDCAVLDISMHDFSGIEVAKRLKAAGSGAKVVFLTVHEDPDFVDEALAVGATGYVVKSRMASDLRPALKRALAGGLFISPSIKMT